MRASVVAWIVWAASMAVTAVGVVMVAITFDVPVPDTWAFRGFAGLSSVLFGSIGLLIVTRRANTIGWLLMLGGADGAIQVFAEQYGIYGVLAHPGSLPGAAYAASLLSWLWILATFSTGVFVPLLFPDGRLPSARWWPVAALGVLGGVVTGAGLALGDGPAVNATYVRNPFGIAGFPSVAVTTVGYSMWFVAGFAAAFSIIWRYQRSRGIEREQIKWLAFGTAIAAVGALAGAAEAKLGQYFYFLAIGAIPLCVTIAILRYRLYDIDVLINRTIVYGALSVTLAASYVGFVVLFQAVLRPLTGGSEIAVAASTLGTIALFQPLRRRIQAVVDRRFYRARYDAQQIVDTFTARLRDEVDLDDVRGQLLGAVHATVQPRGASVWVRGERG